MILRVANIMLEGRWGGPQHRILQVAEGLRLWGIETVVVVPKADSQLFADYLKERGISVRRLSLHHLSRRPSRLLWYTVCFLPELISLRRLIRREGVQLVHCNGIWQPKSVLAGKLAGAKVVLHLNDTLRGPLSKALFAVLGTLCDAFIVTGGRVREAYFRGINKRLERKRITEIQAPVDASVFNPDTVVPDPRLASDAGIKVTTVGNINPIKGLEHFVEMARILSGRRPDLRFYIVGPELETQKAYSGALHSLVKRYGLNNVFFYGRSEDVASVLKATDIFVCSSLSESGPMSVWEAMAMGRAIVSTDVGDASRYIRHGENGFVVPPGDAIALAYRVGQLIDNEELRQAFGAQTRQTAVDELHVDIAVAKHRELYLSLTVRSG